MHFRTKSMILSLLGLFFLISILSIETNASSPERELLLLDELPCVITPTRLPQPIIESPSTITVLTKEDIRRYGNISLSDILRNIPGVDVMSVSPTDTNISMRGFNQLAAGRILTLIDNRPINVNFYGTTLWELLPVPIEEIERIEIIRGPGSALYGADAFDGMVNIITNSNLATIGTRVTTNVNQSGGGGGAITHGGGVGNLTYNASIGRNKISGWDNDVGDIKRLYGGLQYSIDDKSAVYLAGGNNYLSGDLMVFAGFDPLEYKAMTRYIKMDYIRPNLKGSIFWNGRNTDTKSIKSSSKNPIYDVDPSHSNIVPGQDITSCLRCHASWNNNPLKMGSKELSSFEINDDSVYAELQNTFNLLDENSVTWGLNYQYNKIDSEAIDSYHSQNKIAGYIQDQHKLFRILTITTGLRYDRHPLTGNSISERVSIVLTPLKKHPIRLSVGRAFRNPSYLYSYLSTDFDMTMPMFNEPIPMKVVGNRELSPEWMTSHEIGYQGTFGNRFRCEVDLFFNRLRGLIDYGVAEYYDENALFPGSPGGTIPSLISVFNTHNASSLGGELSANLLVTNWLSGYANYSYQHVKDLKTGKMIESAPQNKLNSGLCIKFGKTFTASFFTNYVDKTAWDEIKLDPYMLLNSAISYRVLDGDMEISLSASNLLNNIHREYTQGDEVGRSMLLSLVYRLH